MNKLKKIVAGMLGLLSVVFGAGLYQAQAASMKINNGLGAEVRLMAQANHNQDRQNDDNRQDNGKVSVSANALVRINEQGGITLDGLKVTSVSRTTISGTTLVNGVTIPWTIMVDSNTKILDQNGTLVQSSTIAVGNMLKVDGTLTAFSSTGITVQAKTVRNKSVDVDMRNTFQGTLKAMSGTTLPGTLTVTIGGIDYTVNVSADTLLLTNIWGRTNLGAFHLGDTVRIYGSVTSTNTIDAVVVRDTNITFP